MARRLKKLARADSSESEDQSADSVLSSDGEFFSAYTPLEYVTPRSEGAAPTVPRTSHVGRKTVEKIRRGEYFKMSKLLPDNDEEEDDDRSDRKKPSAPLSFYNWIKCYHTFMSIRLRYHSSELQGMLRYAEIIQDLHTQGRDFSNYDVQFRKDKQQWPEIKWGEYLHEIINKLSIRPTTSRRPIERFASQPTQERVCYGYNSPKGCTSRACIYKHSCRNCLKLGHPVQSCFKRNAPRDMMPNRKR